MEGDTLAARLARRGPLPLGEVRDIGRALAGALAGVHGAGLVHGDVKAQNVMRESSGRVVLMDFGAGTDAWADPDAPMQATLTPRYAAPEVRHGGASSPAADVYSLGVLLHVLATGAFPDGQRATSVGHGTGRVPAALARVLAAMCDDEPRRRPTAGDVARLLAPTAAGRWLLAGWLAMVFGTLAAGLWFTGRRPAPPPAPPPPRPASPACSACRCPATC